MSISLPHDLLTLHKYGRLVPIHLAQAWIPMCFISVLLKSLKNSIPISNLLSTTASPLSKPQHHASAAWQSTTSSFMQPQSMKSMFLTYLTTPTLIHLLLMIHLPGFIKSIAFHKAKIFTAHQDCKIRVWQISHSKQHHLISTLPTLKDRFRHFVFPRNYVSVRRTLGYSFRVSCAWRIIVLSFMGQEF